MHESGNRHVEILDFLTIISELIEIDLLIQNKDLLNSSEDESKKLLQLKLRNNILRLINIKNKEIALDAEEWYSQKIRNLLSDETLKDAKALKEKSIAILQGLDSFRMKEFRNKPKNK